MTKDELNEFIKQEVTNAAFEQLKKHKSSFHKGRPEEKKTLKPKGLTEKELDVVMFGEKRRKRGQRPQKEKASAIMESQNRNPQITMGEVHKFEDDFEKLISEIPNASVAFNKQPLAKGRSMLLRKRPDGIDATASGIITVGDQGTLKWNFSLFGGLQVETVGNFKMELETKLLFEKLYNFYSEWQNSWRNKLTTSPEELMGAEMESGTETGTQGEAEPKVADIPMIGGQAGTPGATSL